MGEVRFGYEFMDSCYVDLAIIALSDSVEAIARSRGLLLELPLYLLGGYVSIRLRFIPIQRQYVEGLIIDDHMITTPSHLLLALVSF